MSRRAVRDSACPVPQVILVAHPAVGPRAAPFARATFALWLCHSGNVLRFHADTLDLFANGVSELDDGKLDDKPRRADQGRQGSR